MPSSTAGQRQANRVQAAAAQCADQRHQQGGKHRAGKGEPQIFADVSGTKESDAQYHGKPRAGVNAENAGVGQRIAGEGLHQHAGQAQGDTRQHADQRARQPGVGNDGAVGAATLAVERLDNRVEGDRFGTERQAEQHDDQQGANGNQQAKQLATK
ncbi:hypothetical protein D3C80_205950 [compost metagenome]